MHFRPLPSAFNSTLARHAGQTRISSNCSLIAIGQHLAVKIKSPVNATNEGSKLISIARFVVGIVVQWCQEIGFCGTKQRTGTHGDRRFWPQSDQGLERLALDDAQPARTGLAIADHCNSNSGAITAIRSARRSRVESDARGP